MQNKQHEFRILCALRRIIRSVDIYSRKLHAEHGLTTPQLICLSRLSEKNDMTLTELSKAVNLSQSTTNGIVDRLEKRGLILRTRDETDRRKIHLTISDTGLALTARTPSLLQDKLCNALAALPDEEQGAITESLEKIVHLMELTGLDASPNLLPSAQAGDEIKLPPNSHSPSENSRLFEAAQIQT